MSSTNNPNRERALELKVGVFVLIGFFFIGGMAFKFGRVGQGLFQQYYPLTVSFPSADGIIKNSDVMLAGARVGFVSDKPVISPSGSGVVVKLNVQQGIKIPRLMNFHVNSSGLMGDKFVEAVPSPEFHESTFNPDDPRQVFAPGEAIQGSNVGGLQVLQDKAEVVFADLQVEIQKLTEVTNKINQGILSTENQKNIAATFANLKETSDNFKVASKDLDGVVQNAKGAVDSAKQTMVTVNGAASDLHGAIADAEKTLDSVRALILKAQTGTGLVATLLNDRQLSENLQAFAVNLRQRGVLFYKNRETPAAAPVGGPKPAH